MIIKFIMELTGIFTRSLEKQPFIVIFLTLGLVALGWWNLETSKDVKALNVELQHCADSRTKLEVRVAVLETKATIQAESESKVTQPARPDRRR